LTACKNTGKNFAHSLEGFVFWNSDGNTLNDIVIAADCKSLQLRAERDANRNGRVYTVTLKVTDSSGNVTTATRKVTVPISPGAGAAVDSGPAYTVNSGCP
jgi:hypothetical protein